eukprot:6146161-Karenia_brevis.AAC.1
MADQNRVVPMDSQPSGSSSSGNQPGAGGDSLPAIPGPPVALGPSGPMVSMVRSRDVAYYGPMGPTSNVMSPEKQRLRQE